VVREGSRNARKEKNKTPEILDKPTTIRGEQYLFGDLVIVLQAQEL